MKDFLHGALAALIQRVEHLENLLDRAKGRELPSLLERCAYVQERLNQNKDVAEEALTLLSGLPQVVGNVW